MNVIVAIDIMKSNYVNASSNSKKTLELKIMHALYLRITLEWVCGEKRSHLPEM